MFGRILAPPSGRRPGADAPPCPPSLRHWLTRHSFAPPPPLITIAYANMSYKRSHKSTLSTTPLLTLEISLWAGTTCYRHLKDLIYSHCVVLFTMLFDGHSVNSSMTCYRYGTFVTL